MAIAYLSSKSYFFGQFENSSSASAANSHDALSTNFLFVVIGFFFIEELDIYIYDIMLEMLGWSCSAS